MGVEERGHGRVREVASDDGVYSSSSGAMVVESGMVLDEKDDHYREEERATWRGMC